MTQGQRESMKIRAAQSLFLLCVLAANSYGHSQAKHDVAKHPKLGLVLEGGGALGLAHIGVITWMEEHRIPVSYVAGTSMGGLVGGIYATGRSPAEVRELINGIDWDQVLSGVTPFRDLSYRRKQDAREVPGQLEFGLRGGLQFPSGFNTGQEVIVFAWVSGDSAISNALPSGVVGSAIRVYICLRTASQYGGIASRSVMRFDGAA